MNLQINGRAIELVQGDITRQEVDAIVNAANSQLAGGGGVDGAIHRAGGPSIKEETNRRYRDGCPAGSAVISGAGNLPAKYVIHAVGPVYDGGNRGEADLLSSAYRRSLQLATEHQCQSMALPSLSTGAYGYPLDAASRIALATVAEYLKSLSEQEPPQLVRFALFSDSALQEFSKALNELD